MRSTCDDPDPGVCPHEPRLAFRRVLRTAFAVLLALAALSLASGCSRSAMAARPSWEAGDDPGSAETPKDKRADLAPMREDRVNVWPLFYKQTPAVSVLWPLISANAGSHAVVPFYEWRTDEERLRLLSLHQDLPAFADFHGNERYYRFFNFWVDAKEGKTVFFPFYWRNRDRNTHFLFPLFYSDNDGFWTPLYTDCGRTRGVLGPLFLRYRGRTNTYSWFPFPLIGTWSGESAGAIAFPLFYTDSEAAEADTNILGPLLHRRRRNDDVRWHFLWPLGAAGTTSSTSNCYFVPLWYSDPARDGTRESSTFLSLPYFRIADPETSSSLTSALGPVYIQKSDAESSYATLFFPLVHWFDDTWSRGSALLPLYYHTSARDGSGSTLLTPIFSRSRKGSRGWWTLLFPLFTRYEDYESEGHVLAPLFAWDRETSSGIKTLLTPLVSFRSDGAWHNVLGFVYHDIHRGFGDDASTERWLLWPLAHTWRGRDQRGFWLLPFLWHGESTDPDTRARTTTFLCWFYNMRESASSRWRNILGFLFHHAEETIVLQDDHARQSTTRQATSRYALWPFLHDWNRPHERGSWFFPLWYHNRSRTAAFDPGAAHGRVITQLAPNESTTTNFLGPIYFSTDSAETSTTYRTVLSPLWHDWSNRIEPSSGRILFPFFLHLADPGESRFYSLLVSSGSGPGEKSFLNVLGPIFHRQSHGEDHTTWFLFPFIRTSSEEAGRKFGYWLLPLLWREREQTGESTSSGTFSLLCTLLLDVKWHDNASADAPQPLLAALRSRFPAKPGASSEALKTLASHRLLGEVERQRVSSLFGIFRVRTVDALRLREASSEEHLPPGEHFVRNEDVPRELALASADEAPSTLPSAFWQEPFLPFHASTTTPADLSTTRTFAYRVEHIHQQRFFPLFWAEQRGDSAAEFELLWRLFDTRHEITDDGVSHARTRVLWKLFDYQRDGETTALDMFPFVTADRAPESGRFLFLGGLLGWGHKEQESHIRLLFIPITL